MFKRIVTTCLVLTMLLNLFPIAYGATRGVSITGDADFFSKLNLSLSGLEKVKTAVGKSDYTTAKNELLTYYQNKFSNYDVKPFSGANDNQVFLTMNNVWSFSENYLAGQWITSTSYEPYTFDLSTNLNGNYVLDQIYQTTDGVAIATSESGNPPQLSLYNSGGTLLKTITATEDTAVRPGKDLSAGYGGSTVIYAKHWVDTKNSLPYSAASTRCYIRFDATQIPSDAKTAKLTVYCRRSSGNGIGGLTEDSLYLSVFQSYCTNWTEDSLTWDTLVSGNYVGHYSYDGLTGDFDWKKPKGTPSEWLNYNTRFYEVRSLVIKGMEAGDQTTRNCYMNKAKELVLDFINDAGHNTPKNRALEPANRLIEFPYIYKHLVCNGYITPDENITMLSWLYDDTTDQYNGAYTLFTGANAIPKSNLPYTNWGLWHLTGFYSALSYFPEFSESGSWRSVYDARLGVVMGGIIKDDGSYNEVTFGYPGSVLSWCATLKDIMNQFGDSSNNAAMFTEKMLLLTKYLIDCSLPNGKLPFWGEGGPSTALSAVNTTLAGLTAEELQTDLAKYLQYYKDSNYGLEPSTMVQYDGIQLVTDRTGWTKSDSMIFMNAKSAGSHSHRDALALLLYYDGRSLLTDTGMTSYDGAHQHYPFQRSSTRSHNTIEVDGTAQTLRTMVDEGRSQGDIQISGNSAVSTITSWSTANNPDISTLKVEGTTTSTVYHSTTFTHSRAVSYVKELGSFLVVTDKVEPQDTAVHQYTQNWHSAPYSNANISADDYLTGSTAYSTGPNLIIAQAGATDITASIRTGYDATTPATPTRYFEYKKNAAGTVTYQTILYPVAQGGSATVKPNKISMSNTADSQALAMEVAIADTTNPELSGFVHYHSFESSPTQRAFGNYSTNSTTAMAAMDQEGKLFFASIANGNKLVKNGIPILEATGTVTDLTAVYEDGIVRLYSEDIATQSFKYTLNFDGKQITAIYLNDIPMTYHQDSNGTCQAYPSYVLLDFTENSMEAQSSHWDGLRSTATVDTASGILYGTIDGGDPNIRMNTKSSNLGYEISAGHIIEIRMKTTITEGTAKGIQVFFRDRNTANYSETNSLKNLTIEHATDRYNTIQLPFTATASYIGKTIDNLRLDMLHLGSSESVKAIYEIDYIYMGPPELAPSGKAKETTYLYFSFSNKTVDNERYQAEAYGGFPYDLGCWGYNSGRNTAPQIDNTEGTLSIHIRENNSDSYVQTTTPGGDLFAMPLYYLPKAGDTVQVRLRFENCTTSSASPKLALYYIGSDTGQVTNDHSSVTLDVEKIGSGEYIVAEFPVPQGFINAQCINALRFTVAGVEDNGSGDSLIIFDYFYVGSPETLPIQNKLYFGFDNTEADRERYNTATYGGYNFDIGNWGTNINRAQIPIINPKEGTLSVILAAGSTNPYFQTTTGPNTLSTKPLTYIPDKEDVIQLKVKFQNCIGTSPYLSLYYMKDDSGTVTSNNSKIPVDPALLDADSYVVLTFPVPSGFTGAKVINAIRITGVNIGEKVTGEGKLIFDYIYIGPEADLPTPRYTVTFLNSDGTTLDTLTVHKGESAKYTGTTPTKACDSAYHYTFAEWDRPLTNINRNTTITATYVAIAHTYTYAPIDGTNHSATCSCGYTVSSAHSWGEGKITSNTSCTDDGTMTYTCTVCNIIKNVAIPAYGHSYTSITTNPACTTEGYTTYTCVGCGHSYTENKVPATGHAPVYTDTDAKSHIITCENCDFTEEASHSYENGICICGRVEIKEPVEESTWKLGHSLNLASDISINYAIAKSTLAGYDMDTIYILAEIDTYTGNEKTGTKEVKILPVLNGNYYYFTLEGITAVNMNDEIRAVLYATKDGQVHYSPVDTYSVATYAYAQLVKATAQQKLKVLCAELLRYGSKAQTYKGYRTDSLVDAKMTEEQRALLSNIDAVTFGSTNITGTAPTANAVQWLGKSLDLASKVSVKFIFSLGSYTGTTEELNLKVTYTDVYGKEKELIIPEVEIYNASRGYYAFTLDSLLAAELRSVLTVQILSGDTVVSGTLQYAADTYGNGKTGTLGDLCKALFAYSDSAKNYFA